jgi:hypothetical protein
MDGLTPARAARWITCPKAPRERVFDRLRIADVALDEREAGVRKGALQVVPLDRGRIEGVEVVEDDDEAPPRSAGARRGASR